MINKTILEINELLKTNQTSIKDIAHETYKSLNENDNQYNAINSIVTYQVDEEVNSLLSGVPVAIKDNINIYGSLTTCSSKILENFHPIYEASIIKLLKKDNALICAKTNLDQFGMGGTGENSIYGKVSNPHNPLIPTGGSSSGSAAIVASGLVSYAIGSDTGDSIRKPAAYCGVYGYKPTWSTISRYGMMPYASSLDTVGVITRCADDLAIVAQCLNGPDKYDTITMDNKKINYYDNLNGSNKPYKVAYIKQLLETYNNEIVLNNFQETLEYLKSLGCEVIEIDVNKKLLQQIRPVYGVLSNAEASSNLANLNGVAFGNRVAINNVEESMKLTRQLGFTLYTKARLAVGAKVLHVDNKDKYYNKALRTRTDFINKFNEVFSEYDLVISPCMNNIIPSSATPETFKDRLISEDHMALANLIGGPSITIPTHFIEQIPYAINILTKPYNDQLILDFTKMFETNLLEKPFLNLQSFYNFYAKEVK